MSDHLYWHQCGSGAAFFAITARKTYHVGWLPDAHAWVYDGRTFEHVDMARGAAETEHMLAMQSVDDKLEH